MQNRIPDTFTMDMNIPEFPFNQCKICIFLYQEISRNIRRLDLTIYRLPKKRGSCIISTSEMENCSSYQVLASYLASCVSKIVHIMQKQKQHSIKVHHCTQSLHCATNFIVYMNYSFCLRITHHTSHITHHTSTLLIEFQIVW